MTAPVMDIADVIREAAAAALPADLDTASPSPATEDTDSAPETDESDAASETPDAPTATDLEEVPADEADDASDDAPAEDAVELPEGYVAVPTVTEGLAAEFVLKDGEGEVEVPNLIVEYKANGKVRQDRLDQVVKLAQWGVYNQEREAKVKEAESAVTERDQLAQLIAEREAQMERLLVDPDFLYSVQQAYEQENSPEQRAARAEQQVQDLRIQQQMQGITQQGEQFYSTEIVPALEMIQKALPTISEEELSSRMMMALQAHAEVAPNGQPYVPASRYDAIRQYVMDDLAIWAQALHVRRAVPAAPTKAEAKAERELERARVEAQKAKRMVGHTTKPVGPTGSQPVAKKASSPSTVDDAVESALQNALASFTSR